MAKNTIWKSNYFCGNEISDYGKEHGYVDYRTLAKSFSAVLNNEIMGATEAAGVGYWEMENGYIDNSEEIEELREQVEQIEEEIEDADDDKIEELEEKKAEIEEQIEELEEEQDNPPEIFQFYIIDGAGAEILEEYTDEIVYYNDTLDMYLWGVTHYGTSWDYVLTDIKIEKEEATA